MAAPESALSPLPDQGHLTPAQRKFVQCLTEDPEAPVDALCQRAGVSVRSYYGWCQDRQFRALVAAAWRSPERQRADPAGNRSPHSKRPTGATRAKSGEPLTAIWSQAFLFNAWQVVNHAAEMFDKSASYARFLFQLLFDPKGQAALASWQALASGISPTSPETPTPAPARVARHLQKITAEAVSIPLPTRQLGHALSASERALPGSEFRPQPDQREGDASPMWPGHPVYCSHAGAGGRLRQ